MVVEIGVVEKKTGTFSIGGGYSADDGMSALASIGDSNYKGSGNNVKLSLTHGITTSTGTGWDVSFTNPHVDDKKTSLSISIFNSVSLTSDYGLDGDNTALRSTYYKRSRGISLSMGRPQGEYIRNSVTLTKKKDSYVEYYEGDVDYTADSTDDAYDADYNSDYIADNFGEVHSITLAKVYDDRDNIFNPTTGKRISLTAEFAGNALGGEFDYNKYTFDMRQYFPVGSKQTLAYRVKVGSAIGDVPDASEFVAGGIDTLRGYEDNEFKGDKTFTASLEYRYPLADKVQGLIFTDVGNAWDGTYTLKDLKCSIGTGVRVNTPIGALSLDYGYGSEGGRVHFGLGSQF